MNSTTTGVLLINAEATATMTSTSSMAAQVRPPAQSRTLSPMALTAPVRTMALLTRNMAPTVITAGLENPATASPGVRMPETISATIIAMAVRSMGIFSLISR
jgi:hypothetical protein